ncbi:MAG: hypothetical protein F6K42_12835 [Leptolyngbya sp. SIO1D8]|nr:hypothetical protein [Leptolyngbya sp. SIO1D8]
MKRRYHIPTRIKLSTELRPEELIRLQETIFAAIRRAATNSGGEVSEPID